MHGSRASVVDHNEVTGANGWGISIQTGAHQARVTRNGVSGILHEHAIKLTHADGAVVSGNTTSKIGGQGIYLTIGTNRADVRDDARDDHRG